MRHLTPGGSPFSPGFPDPEKESSTPPDPEAADLDDVSDRASLVLQEKAPGGTSLVLDEEGPGGTSVVLQAEIEDLERELRAVRKKERWHFIWALIGTSPGALIPVIGLSMEGSHALAVLLSLVVMGSQFLLGVKASGKAARLERALEGLRGEEPPDPR